MRFGPTSIRLQSVLARNLRRPKLSPELKISEQIIGGEKTYVIKIPATDTYLRFDAFEMEVLRRLDGTRTLAQVAEEVNRVDPEANLDEGAVADFLDTLDPSLWERSVGEKNLAILEKIREERAERVKGSNILYIYFSAWNPDKTLERLHPYLKWLFTPGFVTFSILLFISTFVIIALDWPRIRQDTIEFYNFSNKTAYDLWIFWVLLLVVSGVHEFGHGLSCKHFGGEVPQMGLMLIYFTPAFYTDCTDMHMFDRTSKRLWTIFNGIWVEMVMCGIATLVWFFSPPGSFIGDISYKTLLLTGVSGIFFNLNPLMKFDGYYALAQYLEIDNLREEAFEYWKLWIRRTLFRQDVDLPAVGKRRRRIFLIFATAAFLYGVFILVMFSLFIKNVFTSKFGDWGYPLTAVAVYLLLRKRLRKSWPGIRAGFEKSWEKFMAWKITRPQMAGFAAVALLAFLPSSTRVSSDFILEPARRVDVRAVVPGTVTDVLVREGEQVSEGAVMAILHNPEIEARADLAQSRLALAENELAQARARADLAAVAQENEKLQLARVELEEARRRREALTLRAPLHGLVVTPQVENRRGDYLEEGEEFARIVDRHSVRARILVRDWELEDVSVGNPARLKVRARPLPTFEGSVEQIMPAAALDRPVSDPVKHERFGQETTNFFAVVLTFPNEGGQLQEGMTGTAKLYGKRYPLAVRAGRAVWRWFRSQVW
jgi:putative peptide zinc metalloprotease protein